MSTAASITITPIFVAGLLAEGERMPVYVHVIAIRDSMEFRVQAAFVRPMQRGTSPF